MTLTKAAQSRVDRLKGQLQDGSLRRNGGTGAYSGAFIPSAGKSGGGTSTETVLSTSARHRIDALKQKLSDGGLRDSGGDIRVTQSGLSGFSTNPGGYSRWGLAEKADAHPNRMRNENTEVDLDLESYERELAKLLGEQQESGKVTPGSANYLTGTGTVGSTPYAAAGSKLTLTEDMKKDIALGQEISAKKQYLSQAITEKNLAQLQGWDEADRAALDSYIIGRDQRDAFLANPMADRNFLPELPENARRLIAKYGQKQVDELAESLTRSRNEKVSEKTAEAARDAVNSGTGAAIGHNIASIPANAVGGLTGLMGYMQELGRRTGQYPTLDPNNAGNLLNVYGSNVRAQTAQNISGDTYYNGQKVADGGAWRQLLSYGYQGIMGVADTYARMALGGGSMGGATLAATNTFAQTMSEASAQGAPPGEAALLAVTKAGIEALSEKIPLDELVKTAKSGKKPFGEILKTALAQAGIEATTEEISLLGFMLAEGAILQEKSAYKGKTWQDLLNEMWETGIVSAISGGASSVGASVAGNMTASDSPAVQAQEMQTPQQRTEEIRTPAYEELITKNDIPVIEVGRNAGNKTYAELREDALNIADLSGWYDAPFVNKDTNIPVFLTRKSFTHSTSGLTESFGEDTLLALQQTPKLIENAVLTNAAPPRDPSKGESRVLTMLAAIKGSNGIEPIKITVKQFDNKPGNNPPKNILEYFRRAKTSGGYNTLYDMRALEVVSIENAKKEFDASGSAAGSTAQPEAKTTSNSNIRVADLLDLVKGDAEKYIPQKRDVTQVSAEGQTTNHETNARSALASPSPEYRIPEAGKNVNGDNLYQQMVEQYIARGRADTMGQAWSVRDAASAVLDTVSPAGSQNVSEWYAAPRQEAALQNAGRKPKVHFDRRGKKLNGAQETALTQMEQLSVLLDVEFEVFESYISAAGKRVYRDENGVEQAAPNGWYDPATGKIHVDLNAGADGRGTMLFTVAHELTHFIRQWSPARFDKLAEAVLEPMYKEKNISVVDLVRKQQEKAARNGMELSFEEAYEEMVADSMESILTSGNVVELMAEVKQRDVSLWEKLREWFRSLAEDIKKLVRAYRGYKPDSAEGRAVASMKELLPVIEGFYADALMEASENRQGAEGQKNTTREGGAKYHARNAESFTASEAQAIQNIGRKSIFSFTSADIKATERLARRYWMEMGNKSPFFRAWFGDWRVSDKTGVHVANIRGDSKGVQKNDDTGWDIQVSRKIFSETWHHTDSYNIAARPYLPYINDIVRKAVLLDTWGFDRTEVKSENSLLMHSLYAVADIGKGPEVLKLYVEEMNDPNRADTAKRSYQLQNIEKYRPAGKSSQNTASSISPAVGNINTVADLFAYVKQLDKNFNPKDPSKVVDAEGKPRVMYHGSKAQFEVFDKTKAKSSGLYGRGFCFTDSTSHAGTYGNLYSVYLNIQNPLRHGGGTVSRGQVHKFLEAVAENEDYSIENYGTYDINEVLKKVMGKQKNMDAFQIIQDINATAIGDMVEAVELFNTVNGTSYDGIVAPTETVAFYPEQIKSATDNAGTFDGKNPSIKHSLRDPLQEKAVKALEKENAQLKEDVTRLRELVKLQGKVTNGTRFKHSSVEAAAKYLKKLFHTGGDTKELTDRLKDFYEYMAAEPELTLQTVQEHAAPIIEWLCRWGV